MSKDTIKKYLKEWSEDEDPLQELAELVGKGGKLPNPQIAKFLKTTYDVSKKTKVLTPKQVMDMLEDHNFHTEMAMLEAAYKKNKAAVSALIDIAKMHNKIGSMPTDLSSLRSYVTGSKYWNGIDGKRNSQIPLSKDAMRIAKKHLDKKQYDEFTGAFRQLL
jgi:hypothetical protein